MTNNTVPASSDNTQQTEKAKPHPVPLEGQTVPRGIRQLEAMKEEERQDERGIASSISDLAPRMTTDHSTY